MTELYWGISESKEIEKQNEFIAFTTLFLFLYTKTAIETYEIAEFVC